MANPKTMDSPLNTLMFTPQNIDLKKVNPSEIASDPALKSEYDKLIEAREQYIQELQNRYAQPNWFKVAAGFAKPQLGGFLSSLGSASEAMGDYQEQARAIQPTIAQMRAENAMGQLALSQGMKAAGINQKAIAEGRIPTPVEAAQSAGLTGGPGGVAKAGQEIQSAQIGDFIQALRENRNYLDLVQQFGKDFVDKTLPQMLSIPGIKPPQGYTGAGSTSMQPAQGGAPGPMGSPPPAPPPAPTDTSAPATAGGRTQIPGLDVNSMTEGQYLAALKGYNELKQERYAGLTKDVGLQARSGQKVYETAQQIHDIAGDPVLGTIFAQFEKGNPSGIIGKMLESQGLSSTLANMREYVKTARLGANEQKNALTKLNQLENLMGSLQTEMQNAVINPTNERTMAEFASLPNLKNTQDAFLRSIRYIANEGLTKYENQIALQRASSSPQFDPMYWTMNPEYSKTIHNANVRREAVVRNPGTQDRPAFMRGSIDEVAYKGDKKEEKKAGNKRLTAKELRERANKPD